MEIMGFVWVQSIAVGASIDSVDATEIRTNIDTVDNEKCAADKVGVYAAYCPGYCNDEHTGYQNADLVGVDAAYCPGYFNDEHTGYQNADLVGVDAAYCPGYFNDQHITYVPP